MKRKPEPVQIAKYLPAFVAPKSDSRECLKCIKYTGEYGIATNTISALIFPSRIPPMIQNYYTRELFVGAFPDVAKVVPTKFEYRTKISGEVANELINATTCALSFYGKNHDYSVMKIEFQDGNINVVCKQLDRTMRTSIKAKTIGAFSIYVNPARFIHTIRCAYDFCSKLGEEISFDFGGKLMTYAVSVGDIKIISTPMRADF